MGKVILDDSPLKKFWPNKEQSIFEYKDRYTYQEMPVRNVELSEREYATIYLRADISSRNHIRQTYRLIEYLGDIGGLI